MEMKKIRVRGIPAILWGDPSDRLILAAHGSHSSKIDDCIWILAEEAVPISAHQVYPMAEVMESFKYVLNMEKGQKTVPSGLELLTLFMGKSFCPQHLYI